MSQQDFTGPLSRENLPFQFCSDWLKGEIARLFDRIEQLERQLAEAERGRERGEGKGQED